MAPSKTPKKPKANADRATAKHGRSNGDGGHPKPNPEHAAEERTMKDHVEKKEPFERKDFGREQMEGKAGKAFEAQASMFEAMSGGAIRSYEELAEMGRDNTEAMLRVGVAWAKGMEELSRAWSDMTKRVITMQTDAANALVGCRNLKDVVDVQTGLVRDQIETAVNEGTKISELSLRLANEAIQPLSERANANAKKAARMTSAVAA